MRQLGIATGQWKAFSGIMMVVVIITNPTCIWRIKFFAATRPTICFDDSRLVSRIRQHICTLYEDVTFGPAFHQVDGFIPMRAISQVRKRLIPFLHEQTAGA